MTKPSAPIPLELLAPARDAQVALAAIAHGADAIYVGGPAFSARSVATNSLDDLRRIIDAAHPFRVRVYVALNTIIYEDELRSAESLIADLYRIGVDALIVQDMGILRLDIPPIELHASTQCDIRTPEKALMLQQAGFSQLVVARELTIDEMRSICQAVTVPVEAFVHGALCVSYSGDCQASCVLKNRSANRGECAQICRLPYTLTDAEGKVIATNRHLLSLRDLNRSARLAEMIQSGVRSFKIEGRLKSIDYVKNVVAAYRIAIDSFIEAHPDLYCRSSVGETTITFTPDLNKSFNRGYTHYFTDSPRPRIHMASHLTPKWQGEEVAVVIASSPRHITVKASQPLANGDGLGYFDTDGQFVGFRLNRVEGNRLFPASKVSPPPGCKIYRNSSKAWDDALKGNTAQRTIATELTLRQIEGGIALDGCDERGVRATATAQLPSLDEAMNPQEQARLAALSKTGGTIYSIKKVNDSLGSLFVPVSVIANLRRHLIEALDSTAKATYPYTYRRQELKEFSTPATLTYHDNVANSAARKFYADHGSQHIHQALELTRHDVEMQGKPITVMTTRYCLRRELGHCLLTPAGKEWAQPLTLKGAGADLQLNFDCRNCLMHLTTIAR